MPVFAGTGVNASLGGLATNVVSLQAGETWVITPANYYMIKPGPYTSIQQYDPIAGFWRTIGAGSSSAPVEYFYADGVNYRLANQTGCAIGALITNAGSGYTSAPAVAASAGNSIWRAIVGGAISTSVTVTNAGTNYTYPPNVMISAPPPGGIQATGYCTLSGSGITSVTIVDQGAGYASPPTITFLNDSREGVNGVTQGYNAAAVCTLTGAGTITGLVCIDHGTVLTAIPTLAFSGGGGSSAAATTIMCWTITAYTVSATTAGSGYATPIVMSAYDNFPATSPAYTNVTTQSKLLKGRAALIVPALSGTAITATGQSVRDGGIYSSVPTLFAYGFVQGAGSVQAVLTAAVGGSAPDVSYITPR